MNKEKIYETLFLLIGVGLFSFIFYFVAQFGLAIIKTIF